MAEDEKATFTPKEQAALEKLKADIESGERNRYGIDPKALRRGRSSAEKLNREEFDPNQYPKNTRLIQRVGAFIRGVKNMPKEEPKKPEPKIIPTIKDERYEAYLKELRDIKEVVARKIQKDKEARHLKTLPRNETEVETIAHNVHHSIEGGSLQITYFTGGSRDGLLKAELSMADESTQCKYKDEFDIYKDGMLHLRRTGYDHQNRKDIKEEYQIQKGLEDLALSPDAPKAVARVKDILNIYLEDSGTRV